MVQMLWLIKTEVSPKIEVKRGPCSGTTQRARDINAGAAQSMRMLMESSDRCALDARAIMSIDRRLFAA